MKKFNSNYNGLLPIYLNDIRFIQQSYDEQLEAILKPFCELTDRDSFILSGCGIIGGTYAAGWVVLSGKIYRVIGGSVPTPDEYTEIVWTVSTLNIPGGARTPKRIATTVETWQEEVAELTLALIDAPGNIPLNIPTFINTLEQAAPDTGWVNLAMSSGWSFSAEDRPQLRVRNGAAYLRGFVTRDGSTTGIIGVVPSVYRPSRDMSLHDGSIVISASGNITETEAFVDNVSLDDIMWVI